MNNQYTEVSFKGVKFELGHSVKFDRDYETVTAILSKEELTAVDRMTLLNVYNPAYHKGGKIQGITSFDSSATNCGFCIRMRMAAALNPGHICGECYDYEQEHSFKGANVRNRHSLNMLIMQSVLFTREELATLDCTKINRINSSGDVPNTVYAINMLNIAHVNQFAKFAFWAKNVMAVQEAVEAVGKPQNMTLIQSSCRLNHPAKLAKFFDNVFSVYTNKEAVEEAIAAGSGECNGKKCADCGYKCYLNGWQPGQNIAEYLRTNKETRAKIEKAIGA